VVEWFQEGTKMPNGKIVDVKGKDIELISAYLGLMLDNRCKDVVYAMILKERPDNMEEVEMAVAQQFAKDNLAISGQSLVSVGVKSLAEIETWIDEIAAAAKKAAREEAAKKEKSATIPLIPGSDSSN
jgi:hypothetical protein